MSGSESSTIEIDPKVSYPLQARRFDQLRSIVNDQLKFSQLVANQLGVSNSNAYKKIRGEVAVTYDEYEKVVRGLFTKIPTNELNNEHGFFNLDNGPNILLSNPFDAYWERHRSNLNRWFMMRNAELGLESHGIPLLFTFGFPELATLRHYLSAKLFNDSHLVDIDQWIIHHSTGNWINVGKECLNMWIYYRKQTRLVMCIEHCRLQVAHINKSINLLIPSESTLFGILKKQLAQWIEYMVDLVSPDKANYFKVHIYINSFSAVNPCFYMRSDEGNAVIWPLPELSTLATNHIYLAEHMAEHFNSLCNQSTPMWKSRLDRESFTSILLNEIK
jgi:hypothetical protein